MNIFHVVIKDLAWLWHAIFDGTRLCNCSHSRLYRARGSAEVAQAMSDDMRIRPPGAKKWWQA